MYNFPTINIIDTHKYKYVLFDIYFKLLWWKWKENGTHEANNDDCEVNLQHQYPLALNLSDDSNTKLCIPICSKSIRSTEYTYIDLEHQFSDTYKCSNMKIANEELGFIYNFKRNNQQTEHISYEDLTNFSARSRSTN